MASLLLLVLAIQHCIVAVAVCHFPGGAQVPLSLVWASWYYRSHDEGQDWVLKSCCWAWVLALLVPMEAQWWQLARQAEARVHQWLGPEVQLSSQGLELVCRELGLSSRGLALALASQALELYHQVRRYWEWSVWRQLRPLVLLRVP